MFEELFSKLNRKKVRYLVVGGIAVNLYGIERSTADIDLVLDLEKNNLKSFIEAVRDLGLKPKIPVKAEDFMNKDIREKWIKEKGMMVFSLFDPKNSFLLLDVFIKSPFDFSDVYEKRTKIKAGKIQIPLVPLKELIRMKEKTKWPQDKADAYHLKKIIKEWQNEK